LLQNEIPVRTERWDVESPGWMEVDTVAYCEESMEGDFCWSVTLTDVHTLWTEARAIWNKGQHGVRQRISEICPCPNSVSCRQVGHVAECVYQFWHESKLERGFG